MKKTPLIIAILTLGLGVVGYMYSSNQSTTMKLIVGASGGSPDSDATGLRQVNKDLDVEVATLSKERADSLKVQQDAFVMMQRSVEERDASERKLEEAKEGRDEAEAKVKDAESRIEQIRADVAAAEATVHSMPALADADLATAVEKLNSVVEEEKNRHKTLTTDLEEKGVVRKSATEKVASERVELQRLNEINDRFFREYCKNSDEFPILAVDTRWKFVVFNAGKDSGLVAGDSTPLLVKRGDTPIATLRIVSVTGGQIIAEYDEDKMPKGVTLEVGDSVFRQKPLGS